MGTSIMNRISNFDDTTYDTVTAMIDAEDALMKAYRCQVLSWSEYTAARTRFDAETGIQVTNAQALAVAKAVVADVAAWAKEAQKIEVATC